MIYEHPEKYSPWGDARPIRIPSKLKLLRAVGFGNLNHNA
jgi:hypothetical protein